VGVGEGVGVGLGLGVGVEMAVGAEAGVRSALGVGVEDMASPLGGDAGVAAGGAAQPANSARSSVRNKRRIAFFNLMGYSSWEEG